MVYEGKTDFIIRFLWNILRPELAKNFNLRVYIEILIKIVFRHLSSFKKHQTYFIW